LCQQLSRSSDSKDYGHAIGSYRNYRHCPYGAIEFDNKRGWK